MHNMFISIFEKLYKFLRINIREIDCLICSVLLFLIILIIFSSTVLRYFGFPLIWADELSRYLLVYLVFLGISTAVRKNENLSIDFFLAIFPDGVKKNLEIFNNLFLGAFCVIIVILSFNYIRKVYHIYTAALRMPTGWFYMMAPVGFLLSSIYFFFRAFAFYKDKNKA